MKNITIITTLAIMFVTSNINVAQAGSTAGKRTEDTIGNVADTQGKAGKVSFRLESNYIFKRKMTCKKASNSGIDYSYVRSLGTYTGEGASSFHETTELNELLDLESKRVFLNAALGLHPKVDVFIKLGTTDANLSGLDGDVEFDGDYGIAWGTGIKAKLFESAKGFRIIAVAKYLSSKMDSNFILGGEDFSQRVDPGDSRDYNSTINGDEWGIDLYVSKSFKRFSPYLGLNYSDSKIKNDIDYSYYFRDGSLSEVGEYLLESEQEDHFGVLLGTDYKINDDWSLNFETRFIDETAMSFGGTYMF